MIEILTPGPLALVQDLGRPGLASLGVSPSGAADAPALRLANRLVGNDEGAAALEVTLGQLAVRFQQFATVAVTGASCEVVVDGRHADTHAPLHVPAGRQLRLGVPDRGLRSYLAVRGGLEVAPILGSRSTDVLSGIGPAPLSAGQLLRIGPPHSAWPLVDHVATATLPDLPLLEVLPGPRADWFGEQGLTALCREPYTVTPTSNRVALRLNGPRVQQSHRAELPPEGLVIGAVQVPRDGQPVLFLADHPVTGGYPVLAVVRRRGVALAAQVRPGQAVRFVRC